MSDDIQKNIQDALYEIKQTVEEKTKDVVTEEKFSKLSQEVLNLHEEAQKASQEAVALKAALQAGGVSDNKSGLSDHDKKSQELTERFIRTGEGEAELKSFMLDEVKAMGAYSAADGGVTVPKVMSSKIIQRIFETSPVRAVASVEAVSSDSIDFYIDDNEAATGWVSETGTRSETNNPQLGKKTIAVHEQYAKPKATQRIIDDSIFNIESWLANKVADKMARTENTAFINGTGAGQPRGLLTYTAGSGTYNREQIEQVNMGAAAALTGNGLIDVQNSLKEEYQGQASWMMKRSTYGALLQLMYTDNKFDALTPSGVNGTPYLLLGRPIALADDVPAVAANALSVIYGNFSVAYQIVDRQGINLLRDPYSEKPFVQFYFTKRVGADVLNTEAVKIGKVAA